MQIIQVVTGQLEENTYIVSADGTDAAVIDPGENAPDLIAALENNHLFPRLILLTHGHWDHTGAITALQETFHVPVAVHQEDNGLMRGTVPNVEEVRFINGEDILETGGMRIQVLHTPGHSRGSCCYLIDDVLFSGDTLFAGSIGRTDFPESSPEAMRVSLRTLRGLPDLTRVFPGHGPETTIGREKKINPWLR